MRVAELRSQIPALEGMTYLDNAGAGLPPRRVAGAMKRFVDDWAATGEHWDEWLKQVVQARALFGELVGGSEKEVAVVPSVSVGMASIASGLKLGTRRKVVTSALNFPTNVILWQRMRESGMLGEVKVLGRRGGMVQLDDYRKAIDDQTAVVAVDYVSWLSGARESVREVSEIAHRHGALLLVDSFHALGVFPLDVKRDGIDILVSGFYKWLCGPHGVACAYVDRRVLPDIVPSYMGWHGIKENVADRLSAGRDPFDVPFPLDDAEPAPTSTRFEWGTWAAVCVAGAIEAMKFTKETGLRERYSRITKLRGVIREGLDELGLRTLTPPLDENEGSGIVTFRPRRKEAVASLMKKRIVTSGRFGYVRVSPHFYNTEGEAETLISALKSAA